MPDLLDWLARAITIAPFAAAALYLLVVAGRDAHQHLTRKDLPR